MRRLLFAALALLLLLASGCSGDGHYEKRQHYSQRSETPSASVGGNMISGKDALRQAIKNAVDARKVKEELTLQGYDGEWESDLEEIRQEILEVYPYGRYAVESISSDTRPVYTQTRIDLTIKYRDSADEFKDIVYVLDMQDFEARVSALLAELVTGPGSDDSTSKAYYFTEFADTEARLAARLLKCWTDNAGRAIDLRDISTDAYPDGAAECIVEVNVQYLENREAMLAKSSDITDTAKQIAGEFAGSGDLAKIDFIYRWLWENVQYDTSVFGSLPKFSQFTAYGALIDNVAAQSGHVLSAQVLCQALELDSQVVIGEKADEGNYFWLYVSVEGSWMHFDPTGMRLEVPDTIEIASDDVEESPEETIMDYSAHRYLFTLQEGARRFRWDETLYNLEN